MKEIVDEQDGDIQCVWALCENPLEDKYNVEELVVSLDHSREDILMRFRGIRELGHSSEDDDCS